MTHYWVDLLRNVLGARPTLVPPQGATSPMLVSGFARLTISGTRLRAKRCHYLQSGKTSLESGVSGALMVVVMSVGIELSTAREVIRFNTAT